MDFINLLLMGILIELAVSDKHKLLKGLKIPKFAFVGEAARLQCDYDISPGELYSLKWYHNRTEFYRYVPTERSGPINIQPANNFVLHEVSRTPKGVILSLSKLTPEAAGRYRCEVLSEHPTFRTETIFASMKVVEKKPRPPSIKGQKNVYDSTDTIDLDCESEDVDPALKANLQWYLDGKKMTARSFDYSKTDGSNQILPTVKLSINAKKILDNGGKSTVECRLIFGNQYESAKVDLSVRSPVASYVNGFFSTGVNLDSLKMATLVICIFAVFI